MGRYLAISAVCHLALLIALLGVVSGGTKADSQTVYEVAIVGGLPQGSPESAGVAAGGAPSGTTKRFVYTRRSSPASLGEIGKERAGRERAPELAPSPDRERPPAAEIAGDAADLIKAPATAGQPTPGRGYQTGTGGGSEIALWKARVRGMVEAVWRTPPEVEVMDPSLQTTYLLRVGRSGELLQKKLLVSSGNAPFDRSVLVALGRIPRFPPPPLVLIASEDWVEVTMSFTPPKGGT